VRERGDVSLELARAVGGGVLAQDSLPGTPPDRVPLGVGQREVTES
jgi:hypothetical protein